ncbi:hypothetical protein LS482_11270 [Sinomicrobium kalidii]|uniref:hypothetical protein n=1 Tax=Sinomicrobium kalidii TaxID=2900738 RepID=UPI001E5C7292|nr:hypothetical protein [Sinomicrobium kalidii]UGU14292.1 hypothetical protein LS482_11270 [Sinomicrobium kalidii]
MKQTVVIVEIFRTDVKSTVRAEECMEALCARFPEYRINFDLEDRDRILRVEGEFPDVDGVIRVMAALNVNCERFPDDCVVFRENP